MLDGKRIIIAVLLSGLMMTLCSPLSSYAVDADFLSTPSGLSVESAQASEETVESAHLPIYVEIDREAEQITLINRNDFPVDLDIVALDQEGFPIARWPLRVSPTPTEMTVNFADIFWGVPQHQIASIKVTSDEPIRLINLYEFDANRRDSGIYSNVGVLLDVAASSCGGIYDSANPFPCCSNGGNCTWWAWHMAHNNWGITATNSPSLRDARFWASDASANGFPVTPSPAVNTIAVNTTASVGGIVYGHVAWVEQVVGDTVIVSEMVCGGGYGPTYNKSYSASYFNGGFIHNKTACSDFGEPNGAFSSAYAVSCGATASAKICSSTDIDYYKVTPSTSGTMTIRMTPPSDKDYDLYIYNAGQAQVCSSAAGTGLQDVCNVSVTAGQTYYSKVIGYGGAYSTTSNYGLGMTCPSGTVTPGAVSANPASGTWYASPVNLNVSSSGATTIYYTMVNTYDGSTPSDPPAPSPSANNGSLSGPSGVFQLYASSGQYKRSKLRFIGCNSRGCGSASGSFSYTIDR